MSTASLPQGTIRDYVARLCAGFRFHMAADGKSISDSDVDAFAKSTYDGIIAGKYSMPGTKAATVSAPATPPAKEPDGDWFEREQARNAARRSAAAQVAAAKADAAPAPAAPAPIMNYIDFKAAKARGEFDDTANAQFETEWTANAGNIQSEFNGSKSAYIGYRKAETAGRIKR